MSATVMTTTHVVVLLHGLWGVPTQMNTLRDELVARADREGADVVVHACESYKGAKSSDGVDICADRAFGEIKDKIIELKKDGRKTTKFSILGLVAPFAISYVNTG